MGENSFLNVIKELNKDLDSEVKFIKIDFVNNYNIYLRLTLFTKVFIKRLNITLYSVQLKNKWKDNLKISINMCVNCAWSRKRAQAVS